MSAPADLSERAIASVPADRNVFADVIERRLSRRDVLRGGAAVVVVATAGTAERALAAPNASPLGFTGLAPSTADTIDVAPGHTVDVLVRWGDPLFKDAPAFDPTGITAAAQARQFGYNCDFTAFLPLDGSADRGLLAVNHEYALPELMFAGFNADAPTAEQVAVQMAAHGLSIVEIVRDPGGPWRINVDSPYNRRITAETPMDVTGPAAGSPWLRTNADPDGRRVLGTLNNCAGGITPWGTILSAEENFQGYFGGLSELAADHPAAPIHERYGVADASRNGWERYHDRYNVASEPHEPLRFGWVIEVNPFDANDVPRKRTALGRFRHEGAATVVTRSGRVALYSGDDDRFQCVYKFVTQGGYTAGNPAANANLLDDGVLYAARFHDDGTGDWLPLVHGQGPLTGSNGFDSQADVLVDTRRAAAVSGATLMDRPEDIDASPVTGKVYIALTNNRNRGLEGFPPADAANPRAANAFGHILELHEDGDDHAATHFRWEVFMLCGDPADESTYFAGYPKDRVSAIAAPDNLTFDMDGNLWIATDGQGDALEINDALYAVPVAGPERGALRRFLSVGTGAEVCGPTFAPGDTTLFVAVQHPGEGGTFEEPISTWPDGAGPARPSVIAVHNASGGRVGQVAGEAMLPQRLPATGTPAGAIPGALAGAGLALAGLGTLLRLRGRGAARPEGGLDDASEEGQASLE